MRYHVYLEAEPTLEAYRLSHQPRPGYAPVFTGPGLRLDAAFMSLELRPETGLPAR
jgi:hypothetical protein